MARPGRKRKAGKRTKSGRLSRAGQRKYDHGTEAAQWRRAMFGGDGHDAIGRAFAMGLLSDDQAEAKMLRDTARSFAYLYWRWMPNGFPRQAATETAGEPRGSIVTTISTERDIRAERALRRDLAAMTSSGRMRRDFDALVLDMNPDSGPVWLDKLIAAKPEDRWMLAEERASLFNAINGIWRLTTA